MILLSSTCLSYGTFLFQNAPKGHLANTAHLAIAMATKHVTSPQEVAQEHALMVISKILLLAPKVKPSDLAEKLSKI